MPTWEATLSGIAIGLTLIVASRSEKHRVARYVFLGTGIVAAAAALAARIIPRDGWPYTWMDGGIFERLPSLAIVGAAGFFIFTRWRKASWINHADSPTANDEDGPIDSDLGRLTAHIETFRRKVKDADSDPWIDRYLPDIRARVRDTIYDFDRLNRGEIRLVGERACHQLYVRRVLGESQSEIWTTNVAGTFGRQPNEEILQTQRAAIERGVRIRRTFVVPNMNTILRLVKASQSEEERRLLALAAVMQRQKEIGVDVRIIGEAALAQVIQENRVHFADVASNDFMIIDDKFAYITYVATSERLVTFGEGYVRLTKVSRVLHAARRLRDEIGLQSSGVSPNSLAAALDGRSRSAFALLPQ